MGKTWKTVLSGFLTIKIVGKYNELFLNHCVREGILIWNIRRLGSETIVCQLALEDVIKLRPIVRHSKVKLYFLEKKGAPFFFKKVLSRAGFASGLISFIAILFVLSNMVWGIDIKGASPKVEYQLLQALDNLGIKRGKLQFFLPSVEEIQKIVTSELSDATWIGVTLNGTTYHFQVVEQTLPEKDPLVSARHLVARKKAIIHDIFVEQGQGKVVPNDFVNKGDLLISGYIGKEGKTQLAPAKGKVFGEIWYKSHIVVPLASEFTTLTGEKKVRYSLSVMNLSLPIWGFTKPKFTEYEVEYYKSNFRFLKWELPFQIEREFFLEKENEHRQYSEEEGRKVAIEMARDELMKKLGNDVDIIGEKVLHETIENGKVKMMIHYQVIEEITLPQPIIQGD